MQGWFNIHKSINVIQHINRSKDKNHFIISIDAEKAFDIIQYHFMKKVLMKLGKERMNLNIIKVIYGKAIANIIFHGEKLKPFLLKAEMRQTCLLSALLFRMILELLACAIRQEEEIKGIQIDNEVKPIPICKQLDLKDTSPPKKILLKTINSFSKVAGYKVN
jgi:hypothetical protein